MQFKKESSLRVLRHVAIAAVLILASLVLSVLYTVDANRAKVSITYTSNTAVEFAISFANRAVWIVGAPATSDEKEEVSLGFRSSFRPWFMSIWDGHVEIRMASDDLAVKDNPVANLELYAVELHRKGMEPVRYELRKLALVSGSSVSQRASSVVIPLAAGFRDSFSLSGFGDEVVREMETAFITSFCTSFIVVLLILSGGYALCVYTGLGRRVLEWINAPTMSPCEKILSANVRRVMIVLSAIGSFLILICTLRYTSYGISLFGDESFCMVWISNPFAYDYSVTQFGFVYHPLYRLLGGDIAALRQANILLTRPLNTLCCIYG